MARTDIMSLRKFGLDKGHKEASETYHLLFEPICFK